MEDVISNKKDNKINNYIKKIFHNFNMGDRPKCLCVLLCYNDSDILDDVVKHMLANRHDIIAWDHGSDDGTSEVLDKHNSALIERKFVPRSFDFYNLYQMMSSNLIENYIDKYDWISWPDDDEILEGPNRKRTYYDHICEVYKSNYNYIRFNNYNYWFTKEDDTQVVSPIGRIKRYSLFPDCAPRIRSWRASVTNIREFNHNPLAGEKYPINFNLRHYPMRSRAQMMRRLTKDRAELQRGNQNFHYNNMCKNLSKLELEPEKLHYDNRLELNPDVIYNWWEIYG